MSGKPVAEQEIGFVLLQEVAETSMSRENLIIIFRIGEFDTVKQEGADTHTM
jgi:ATP-dependent DNA helicase RecQ